MNNQLRVCLLLCFMLVFTEGVAFARTINWSGYKWTVRTSNGNKQGPGPNIFDDSAESVFVDDDGNLHLKIRQRSDGKWVASEVTLLKSLGYGTYQWEVASRYDLYADNVVAGFFTYLSPRAIASQTSGKVGNGIPDTPHEIDIELSKAFGSGNVNYVTHDPDIKSPADSFFQRLNGSSTTHRFKWESSRISWESFNGHVAEVENPPFPIIEQRADDPNVGSPAVYVYEGPVVPQDLNEKPIINFWLFGRDAHSAGPTNGKSHELIVQSFHYTLIEEPLAGDFDADGLVNESNLAIWNKNFTRPRYAESAQGDADLDDNVDGNDFLIWQRTFSDGFVVASPSAVPDPAASSFFLVYFVVAIASRFLS